MALVSVLDGATFAVSGPAGDIDPAPSNTPQGLFFADTRVLSTWRLTVDDAELVPLALETPDHFAATWILAPLARTVHENAHLTVIRRRLVTGSGMSEELEVFSHGAERRAVRLELSLAADFADLFELKAAAPRERAVERQGLGFRYAGPDAVRTLDVWAAPTPDAGDDGLVWTLELSPGEAWTARIALTAAVEGEGVRGPRRPLPTAPVDEAREVIAAELEEWVVRAPALDTDWAPLATAYDRSLRDLAALRWFPDAGSEAALPAAGLPWFMTLFGRDSVIASLQALPFLPELAATTLRTLARHQGTRDDPRRDEEPGKILHELRAGELSVTGELPFAPYYGTVDATPLWLVLLDEYERWTGDRALVAELEPVARRALDWIDGASAADGFLRYEARAEHGLVNLGWKDSPDSILFVGGRRAEGPIALIEAQGYAIDARRRAARLAELVWDDPALAARERAAADALADATHAAFWLPDREFLALALDGAGAPVDSVTSNAGHLLWSGAATDEAAGAVARHAVGDGLFSGWGVRTMAATEAGYNPLSYHDGTVWPHDSAIVAAGLARAGYRDEANTIAVALRRGRRPLRRAPARGLRRLPPHAGPRPGRVPDGFLPPGLGGGHAAAADPGAARARARRIDRPAAARADRAAGAGRALVGRRAAEPLLARAQQAVAQLALDLGRRIPLVDVGQRVARLEPEQAQEEVGGAVEHGAEARAARLLDQPALERAPPSPTRR